MLIFALLRENKSFVKKDMVLTTCRNLRNKSEQIVYY